MKFKKFAILLVTGVSLATVLTGCSSNDDGSSTSSHVVHKLTKQQRIHKELKELKETYKNDAKVTYSKKYKAFMIEPTEQDFTANVVEAAANGQTSEWNKFTKAMKNLSVTIGIDKKLPNTSVALVNPNNSKNLLYVAKNGETTYDFLKK